MNEQLKNFIEDYKKTDWEYLLRKDHGNYHLKELKPHLDFIKEFTDPLVAEPQKLSDNQQNILLDLLQQFQGIKELIGNYDGKSQRQHMIDSVINFKNWILDSCHILSWAIETQKKLSQPEISVKKYEQAVKELEKELKKTRQTQSHLAEKTVKAEVSFYGDFFKEEADNNKKLSYIFGFGFLGFSLLAGWFAYYFLQFGDIKAEGFMELFIKGNVINKIFIFSILFLIISVIRREYLALRHQFTLNTHRYNALRSHNKILSSIKETASGSDKEISNAILLELTKAMFDPQDTGFVKNQASSSGNRIMEISKSLLNNSKD